MALKALSLRLSLRDTFASLQYRNYRLWFFGQMTSLVGTWMQSTAQGYLIYQLTHSPEYLGYVSLAAGLPSWIFTLYAGVVADRISRRMMLIITQTAMMILAFGLAVLTFTKLVQPWHIIILAFLLGIANAFDAPARLAFVQELVERKDMTNAIALNSMMFNSAVVLGPAIGGLAYAALGPGWCFGMNGLSFVAVIVALFFMRIKPVLVEKKSTQGLGELKIGLGYVLRTPLVRMLILNLGVVSLFGLGIMALMPAWAVDVLGGDSTTNGWLLSARGLGALLGSLMLASLGSRGIRGKLWTLGSCIVPVLMVIFALVRWLPLSMGILFGIGWTWMMLINTTNALVQTSVPDELRGRVMSVYVFVFFGAMPIGSFLAGQLAGLLNETVTVLISGVIMLLFAVIVFWQVPVMRRLD